MIYENAMEPINSGYQKQNASNTSSESGQETRNSNVNILGTSTTPQPEPAKSEQHSTTAPQKEWWDKAKPWVELIGVVLLAIYTGFTIAMYFANNKSADAAKRAANAAVQSNTDARNRFLQDQRPYLWLVKNNPVMGFIQKPGQPLGQVVWDWRLTNYGKTPAYNIRIYEYISLGGGHYVPPYGSKGQTTQTPPLPPTAETFSTVVSKPISPSRFATLQQMFNGVRIKMRIEYEDGSHTNYETGMCLGNIQASISSTIFDFCEGENGNYIK